MDTLPLLLFLLASAAAAASDPQVMTVHPGDDVTLKCEAGDVSIRAVEWSRADLEPEYVLFYRDRRSYPTKQHPSFKGRVELEDRELKDGDVSLTLKNVTSRDNGTYECRVATGGSRRSKRALIDADPIRVIHLEVRGSENGSFPRGHIGVAAGVVVAVLLVAAGVSVAVWRYRRRTDQSLFSPRQSVPRGHCELPCLYFLHTERGTEQINTVHSEVRGDQLVSRHWLDWCEGVMVDLREE